MLIFSRKLKATKGYKRELFTKNMVEKEYK